MLGAYHFCVVATPGRLRNMNLHGRNGRDTLHPVGHKDRNLALSFSLLAPQFITLISLAADAD